MTAITIRRITDHALLAYGPGQGGYEPSWDPATMVRAIESDYATVVEEWLATRPSPVDRKAILRDVTNFAELKAALIALL